MIKLFRRRTKMNQKGMTLVEVIVAMAILAVVVTPTLRMFASASSTNHTSRLRQRATIVGESVMESFKAFDMEALCNQFNGGVFPGVTVDSGKTTMSVTATINGTEKSPFRSDGKLDQSATAYTFNAKNVVSEGQYYDVMVEAKPIKQPTVLRMDSPNAYSDAIIKFDSDFNDRVYAEIINKAKDLCTTSKGSLTNFVITGVVLSDFSRTITIDVDDVGTAQTVKVAVDCTGKATVNYSYRTATGAVDSGHVDYTETDLGLSITLPDETSTDIEMVVYDNTATIGGTDVDGRKCKLNQIFLYYYPVYASKFGSGAMDVIDFEANLTKLYDPDVATANAEAEGYTPLVLNIAKQKTATDDATLNNDEMVHSTRIDGSINGGGEAKLVTNVRKNLSPIGSVMSPVSVIPPFIEEKTFDTAPVGEVELMYDVVVHVYKKDNAGNSEEVATFTGTKND